MRLGPDASGRGLSLRLAPVWGTPSSGVERLWSARDAAGLVRDEDFDAERRLEGEVGYGFGAFGQRGLVTPWAGLGLAEAGDRTWLRGRALVARAAPCDEPRRRAARAGERRCPRARGAVPSDPAVVRRPRPAAKRRFGPGFRWRHGGRRRSSRVAVPEVQ